MAISVRLKTAKIDVASSGDNIIVVAVAGKRIKVSAYVLQAKGTVDVKWKNGAGTDTWSYEGSIKLNRKDFGIGADSVAAKISLKDDVELNLLLVGFFEEKGMAAPKAEPKKPAAKKKAAPKKAA